MGDPKPLGARVLMRVVDDSEGIWLPESTQWTLRAIVVAAGDACLELSVGDVVLYEKRNGLEIRVPRDHGQVEPLILLGEAQVLCILEDAQVRA